MTEDFGKILDQWEGARSRDGASQSAGPPRPTEQESQNQMSEWLNRYPPPADSDPAGDKEAARAGDTAGRTNPEKLKTDDRIDLHGYRLKEALEVTGLFIERCVDSGFRKVLVIHGKGNNGQGVLRREIRTYLEQHPMTGAMGYGRGPEGGRGALWVMLRDGRGAE